MAQYSLAFSNAGIIVGHSNISAYYSYNPQTGYAAITSVEHTPYDMASGYSYTVSGVYSNGNKTCVLTFVISYNGNPVKSLSSGITVNSQGGYSTF